MKWNHPPEPVEDAKRRVVPALGHGKTIVVQAQAFGDPVFGQLAVESIGDHIQPASMYSTAPYQPDGVHSMDGQPAGDKPRTTKRQKRCKANNDTCMAWATKRYPGLCAAHGRLSEGAPAWPNNAEVSSSTSTD
jgi:hypothetical protein